MDELTAKKIEYIKKHLCNGGVYEELKNKEHLWRIAKNNPESFKDLYFKKNRNISMIQFHNKVLKKMEMRKK